MSHSIPENSTLIELAHSLRTKTIDLGYREWNWGEGVAQLGLMRMAVEMNDETALGEVGKFVTQNRDFKPSQIEHVMPAWAALSFYEATGDEIGMNLATRVVDMLREYPRSKHGAFIASPVRSAWVDYIYETAPFLCEYSRLTGAREYRDWAVEQTIAYLMSCWDAKDGLFTHVYYDDTGTNTPFYWARANGWAALGLVEMYIRLPEDIGLGPVLARTMQQLAQSLLDTQAASGNWHTVLKDSRTYEETSATVMISLALRRASLHGMVSPSFELVADNAWQAVRAQIDGLGNLNGVSGQTPPGDADDYEQVPRGVFPWGQGFALLAVLDRITNSKSNFG